MKVADQVIRWFVGLLFIFSGLVKLNDPMGTAIKMEEYFEVFSVDIASVFHYLVPYSMAVGLFVVILEILLGIAVLVNYRMELTSWILLLLIVFFTFLTFYSAYFNKVTDCGCFGDAIPLDPWQSFMKDILLLILIVYLFVRRKIYEPIVGYKIGNIIIAGALVVNLLLAYWAIEHLPFIDFRPYKIGADIRTSMKPSADYKYMYVMEKDGEELELDRYPTDTSYTFVEMVLLNPEAEPKITDYNVWNENGDFTEESLTGSKLLIFFNDVNKSRYQKVAEINDLTNALGEKVESWVITANNEATYENFRHEYQIPLAYYYADGTVIKAVIRANPGLVLMQDGIVLGKWHSNDIPSKEELIEMIN